MSKKSEARKAMRLAAQYGCDARNAEALATECGLDTQQKSQQQQGQAPQNLVAR